MILLILWQLLAHFTHDAIVASPWDTFEAFYELASNGSLIQQLQITLLRLLKALVLGSLIGICLGCFAGFSRTIRSIFEPIRWVAMTVPPIIIAILGMLWFGMGSEQAIFLVTVVIIPVVYINTVAGIDGIDTKIIEMATIYHFSKWQVLTQIFLPGLGYSLIAGLTLATGIGVRAVILAELLGAFEGVGHSFNRAWTYLKTPELFAWILASLLLMAVIEFGLLLPLNYVITRGHDNN